VVCSTSEPGQGLGRRGLLVPCLCSRWLNIRLKGTLPGADLVRDLMWSCYSDSKTRKWCLRIRSHYTGDFSGALCFAVPTLHALVFIPFADAGVRTN